MSIIKKNEESQYHFSKYNHIILGKKIDLLNFYRLFDDILNEKVEEKKVAFNSKIISSKDYVLINLIDIDSLLEQLKFKKGTIIFQYINDLIEDIPTENLLDLSNQIENYYNFIRNKSVIDMGLSFNQNMTKLFSNCIDFNALFDEKNHFELVIEILKINLSRHIDKKYIIFLNSETIQFDWNLIDNVIIFDFNPKISISKTDLFFVNEQLTDFNSEIIIDTLKINWPIPYIDSNIRIWLQYFFEHYYCKSTIHTNQPEIIIIGTIISKLYNLNIKIIFDNTKISNIIQSFIQKY